MLKFFKPEDFTKDLHPATNMYGFSITPEVAADLANNKLEREGKIVYGTEPEDKETYSALYGESKNRHSTHKALLINIENIERCQHLIEDVVILHDYDSYAASTYKCKCGVKLRPTKFEQV